MDNDQKIYIAGIGMITPIGANAHMTAAAVRAGISAYTLSEYSDRNDEPVTMACVPDAVFSSMEVDIERNSAYRKQYDRIIKMAILALQDAFSHPEFSEDSIKRPIPLILAMPESDPGISQMPPGLLIKNIIKLSGVPIDAEQVRCIHTGRAAGIQALDLAYRYLFDQGQDYVLIGGSDSYQLISLVNRLNDQQRLLTGTNKDGFASGEAASFLLLTRHTEFALNKNNQIIRLYPEGIAEEAGHLGSDTPYLGNGLDQAFKQALKGYTASSISTLYSSMNGEFHWAKEQGVAMIRNEKCFSNELRVEHPAEYYGDLGCATGSSLMAISALDLLDQQKPGTNLVYSSSDGPLRGAVLMEKIDCHKNGVSICK